MFALKVKGTDWYLPKTPYKEVEMLTNLLTNDPLRICKYKRKGMAERTARMCPIDIHISKENETREWEIVEIE